MLPTACTLGSCQGAAPQPYARRLDARPLPSAPAAATSTRRRRGKDHAHDVSSSACPKAGSCNGSDGRLEPTPVTAANDVADPSAPAKAPSTTSCRSAKTDRRRSPTSSSCAPSITKRRSGSSERDNLGSPSSSPARAVDWLAGKILDVYERGYEDGHEDGRNEPVPPPQLRSTG
jgi:hypothetical protein